MSTPTSTSATNAKNPKPSDAVETAVDAATSDQKPKPAGLIGRITALIAWVMTLKPVRVFQNYGNNGGPLLASGMSYQAVFAVLRRPRRDVLDLRHRTGLQSAAAAGDHRSAEYEHPGADRA